MEPDPTLDRQTGLPPGSKTAIENRYVLHAD